MALKRFFHLLYPVKTCFDKESEKKPKNFGFEKNICVHKLISLWQMLLKVCYNFFSKQNFIICPVI